MSQSPLEITLFHLPDAIKCRITSPVLLQGDEHREVYAVLDPDTGEKMILKWTDTESADDAAQEYTLLRKLSHESIPKVIAFEQAEGHDYLLRSYAQGETLETIVARDGCFTPNHTAEIAHDLCGVLAYLHGREPPIIFKDIKPENIVLTANGKLSLIDFGIAREHRPHQSRDTRLMGSFPYASPEHLGFKDTDQRSDIFSMGRLMAYLSTGNVHGVPDNRRLQAIIRKCTQLEPRKRYTKVTVLQRALRHLLNPVTRKDLLLAGSVALVVVLIGWTAMTAFTRTPALQPPSNQPPAADGREQADNKLLPVTLSVLKDGTPFNDCVVSADGTHWYVPDRHGQATLSIFPFHEHLLQAAHENKVVFVPAQLLTEGDRGCESIPTMPRACTRCTGTARFHPNGNAAILPSSLWKDRCF